MYRSKLVLYYPSKYFLMLDQDFQSLKKVPLGVKQHIHDFNTFKIDSVMSCNTSIPSVVNTLKNINLITSLFNESTSTY